MGSIAAAKEELNKVNEKMKDRRSKRLLFTS